MTDRNVFGSLFQGCLMVVLATFVILAVGSLSMPPPHKSSTFSRREELPRRAVNIDVNVDSDKEDIKKDVLLELEKVMELSAEGTESSGAQGTPCSTCKKLAIENMRLKKEKRKNNLNPAYTCDQWDSKSHTCWLDRNVGGTVTFVLNSGPGFNSTVQWSQHFHTMHPQGKEATFDIDPDNPTWNVVVGSGGLELRLSPITEIDVDFNYFSASVLQNEKKKKNSENSRVLFRIRVMAVDQGFVYPGETITMNMRRVSLPPTSMNFRWFLENKGESSALPSNMRESPSGGVLSISELRKEQEGILACAVYTNKGFFAMQQRYLIKEIDQNNNMLLFMPTRPPSKAKISKRYRRALLLDPNEPSIPEEEDIPQNRDILPQLPSPPQFPSESPVDQMSLSRIDERFPYASEGGEEIVLDLESVGRQVRVQDQLSRMIAECHSDLECSAEAICIHRAPNDPGFCRCVAGYQGNGIFCWEEIKVRRSGRSGAVHHVEEEEEDEEEGEQPQVKGPEEEELEERL